MKKIAIDAALLLPEKINKICIELNRKKDADAYSDLGKKNNHPHITLAMGVVDEKELPKVESKLKDISKEFSSLKLEIVGLYFQMNPEKKKSYGFTIKQTSELKELHRRVMKELLPVLSYDVRNEMFFLDSDEKFYETSKFWVENYAKKHSSPNKYHPHISLKCRNASYTKFPIKFSASKIAVCQLGNYCTCRKIFISSVLK